MPFASKALSKPSVIAVHGENERRHGVAQATSRFVRTGNQRSAQIGIMVRFWQFAERSPQECETFVDSLRLNREDGRRLAKPFMNPSGRCVATRKYQVGRQWWARHQRPFIPEI